MKKKDAVGKAKLVAEIVSTEGAQMLACGLCRLVLPPQVNIVVKGGMLVGGWLLGGCLGEHMKGYLNRQIDDVAEYVEESVKKVKEDIAIIQNESEETETEKTDQTDQTNENNKDGEDLG